MRIALVQTNPTIGDIDGNAARVIAGLRQAADAGADLALFPEQTLIGYPAKDLLLRRDVIRRNVEALRRIADLTGELKGGRGGAGGARGIGAVVGFAEPNDEPAGRPLYNSVAWLHGGKVLACSRKRLLPTYDVFDEARYFEAARSQPVIEFGGLRFGLTVCEDMWSREEMHGQPLYDCDPIGDLVRAGAQVILNVSASPYFLDKHEVRVGLMAEHARRHGVPILFVNQVGGNDELIFDGSSTVVDASGRLAGLARSFDEDMLIVDLPTPSAPAPLARIEPHPTGPAALHDALVLGLRDYVRKCGFRSVVLGLSGGIDSAVVAALAATALGPRQVHGVAMPSRYSSDHSVADARALAEALGIAFSVIPIEPMHAAYEQALAPSFAGRAPDVTEENIQARVRGALLMALSNKFGSLLLTTGNKSELAVGYCTLYGDMCGGLAVISDVPKTMIYRLAEHINARAGRAVIPAGTLTKPPSAELRPNQTDQDSLPAYDVLDAILERYEVRLESRDEIVAAGFEPRVVDDVLHKIRISEYKRQQAAPGLKVTSRAFGFGRRMPIAAR
ncbi:MAG: NAD+ synthase [Phycisphaerales bacterium]|nr:NAD+ synthase [Phycisphaerales bacterium]